MLEKIKETAVRFLTGTTWTGFVMFGSVAMAAINLTRPETHNLVLAIAWAVAGSLALSAYERRIRAESLVDFLNSDGATQDLILDDLGIESHLEKIDAEKN